MNDPVWRKRSDECKDLVVKMMTVDPKKRITSKEALNHPWIQHKAAKHADDVTMAAGALVNLKNFRVRFFDFIVRQAKKWRARQ